MKNAKFLFALLMSSTLVACGGTNPTEPSSEAKTENKTEEVKNSEAQPTEEVPVVEKEAKLVRSYTGTFAGGCSSRQGKDLRTAPDDLRRHVHAGRPAHRRGTGGLYAGTGLVYGRGYG